MSLRDGRDILGGESPDETLRNWNKERTSKGLPAVTAHAGPDQEAYVNEGRWLVDCPCGASAAVWRDLGQALCLGCGRRMAVTWPPGAEEAERVLLKRDHRHRNWDPRRRDAKGRRIETPAFLEAETTLLQGVIE